MMVAAWGDGIASCPISLHRQDCARDVLGLPDDAAVPIAVGFGTARRRRRRCRRRRGCRGPSTCIATAGRSVFIVTGSGRSGTSAVAKLLHTAGISVGRDLIEPDASNADGYFEERAVVAVNDRILRSAGLFEWFSHATRAQILNAAAEHEADMPSAGARRRRQRGRTLGSHGRWRHGFHTSRSRRGSSSACGAPMKSWPRRCGTSGLRGDEPSRAVVHLWRAQYERLIDVIDAHQLPAMAVEYDALHSGSSGSLAALAAFVGRDVGAVAVRPDLRHHREVPPALRALYARVRDLGQAGARRAAGGGASPSTSGL